MKYTNAYSLPDSIMSAVVNDDYGGPKNELKRLSVSTAKDAPRIHFLKIRHWEELEEDISDRLWVLLGKGVHAVLEKSDKTEAVKEKRLEVELDGLTISGQMDIFAGKKITDYKVTSAWSVVFEPQGKREWVEQQNIYRWLCYKHGIEINELEIYAILRDWQKSKAKADPSYPQIPFVSIKLPVWSFEETEKYLKERISLFKYSEHLPDDKLPLCTAEETWAKESAWAVMKKGRKTALRVFTSEKEAQDYAGEEFSVVHRPGQRVRCEEYCPVSKFCSQYKEYKEAVQ